MPLPERYGRKGQEPNSGEPVALPPGYSTPTPLEDIIARMVKDAVDATQPDEHETMEEFNDFDMDVEEDLIDLTQYELQAMTPEETPEDSPLAAETKEAPQEKTDDQEVTPARQESETP